MSPNLIMIAGLIGLSFLSGMVGLGVAFAAIPFLALFLPDLVHQVQPLSLLLNGITASFSAAGFARSKLVEWNQAIPLAIVCTAAAPLGAWAAQIIPQIALWFIYFAAVLYLAYRLFQPAKPGCGHPRFQMAMILAVPISILSGLLGVGPGFMLLPTLILLCFEPKHAAALTAVAVTPPSFSSLIPHIPGAKLDPQLTVWLLIAGAISAYAGARVTSLWMPGVRIKQMFGVLIVLMTVYKIFTLLG
ncbi:MAG TPA: sulfite exporter TauE/SafE family protein [bacterium]|nr:sulfite exporter TauE/SafE family protein [Candidatus Omnitrophota bacterium]HOL94608.1 sulfite exporter TauE/SafE family protein [bacterium]HPP01368.1 sulfite exporter TauE/SafE family protein [bacterium]